MAEERTVFNTSLQDTPHEYWANTVLARLAAAIGLFEPGETTVQVDPDELLEEVEVRLAIYAASVPDTVEDAEDAEDVG